MNEEGGIYMESFHLNWAKNMTFRSEKVTKIEFFTSQKVLGAFSLRLGAFG